MPNLTAKVTNNLLLASKNLGENVSQDRYTLIEQSVDYKIL